MYSIFHCSKCCVKIYSRYITLYTMFRSILISLLKCMNKVCISAFNLCIFAYHFNMKWLGFFENLLYILKLNIYLDYLYCLILGILKFTQNFYWVCGTLLRTSTNFGTDFFWHFPPYKRFFLWNLGEEEIINSQSIKFINTCRKTLLKRGTSCLKQRLGIIIILY